MKQNKKRAALLAAGLSLTLLAASVIAATNTGEEEQDGAELIVSQNDIAELDETEIGQESAAQCKVTFAADENGSISGETSMLLAPGEKLKSMPDVDTYPGWGYYFLQWQDQDGKTYNGYQILNMPILQDMSFTAIYSNEAPPQFQGRSVKITLEAINGSFAPGVETSFSVTGRSNGTSVDIWGLKDKTIVPDPGYEFFYWLDEHGKPIQYWLYPTTWKDTTYYAFCDRDDNHNGFPDSLETGDEETIDVEYLAGDHGKLSGQSVYQNAPINGRVEVYAPPPTPEPDPGYKFVRWSDASGMTLHEDCMLLTQAHSQITAIYEADDSDSQLSVEYAVEDGSGGVLQGVSLYENLSAGDALANVAPSPIAVPPFGSTLCRWVDADGNTIHPSTAVVGSNTRKITATFISLYEIGMDKNQDKIDDNIQNQYSVRFEAGIGGSLQGASSFLYIGGVKGDGKPIDTALGQSGDPFAVPQPLPNDGYAFVGWTPGTPELPATLDSDLIYTAQFQPLGQPTSTPVPTPTPPSDDPTPSPAPTSKPRAKYVRIRFNASGSTLLDVKILQATTLDKNQLTIPTPTAPKNKSFAGWQCIDGKVRSSEEVLQIVANENMVFRATFKK